MSLLWSGDKDSVGNYSLRITMKILELFCGTKSIGKVAKDMGHDVFSVDVDPEHNPDLCSDILKMDLSKLPWIPDMIWDSPPCTTFSVASLGHHWTGGERSIYSQNKRVPNWT